MTWRRLAQQSYVDKSDVILVWPRGYLVAIACANCNSPLSEAEIICMMNPIVLRRLTLPEIKEQLKAEWH